MIDWNDREAAPAWRDYIHAVILAEAYDEAEAEIVTLLASFPTRAFDPVLDADITSPVAELAGLLSKWSHEATAMEPTTAMSLDFETERGDWCIGVFGYGDDAYPFGAATLQDIRAKAAESPWAGCFGPFDSECWEFRGLEGCQGLYRPALTGDAEADRNLGHAYSVSEVLVGLKYQRFVSRAAQAAVNPVPMWVLTQPHDSYWFPRGVMGLGGR